MTTLSPWEVAARQFEPGLTQDPIAWSKTRLGEYWWSKQREIAQSLIDNRYTAVQSCHGVGKSFVARRLITHWIDTHDVGEAFAVSTAPTAAQVEAILWREVSRVHRRAELQGRIVSSGYPQWKIGSELVAYGRKPADYDEAAFQGIHDRYVLVVVDEAGGVPKSIFDGVDALATNRHARVLAVGNPDDPTSHFAEICKPGSGWNVIRIDGLRSPRMTQAEIESGKYPLLRRLMAEEGIPYSTEEIPEELKDLLIDAQWVEERLERWVGKPDGENTLSRRAASSPLFTAKVRGLFPDSSTEGVIPLGWVERAIDRWNEWKMQGSPPPFGRLVVGADLAEKGEDQTCLALRIGDCLTELRRYSIGDTMETTGYIAAAVNQPHSRAVVDAIGIGAGVVDRLREMGKSVVSFTASQGTKRTDQSGEFRFQNLRAAAWWNMREMLDPARGSTVMLPDDDLLRQDLTAPKYKVLSGGVIAIEKKDDIRKRLGRSTDTGDATVQAFDNDARPVDGDSQEPSAVGWWDGAASQGVSWNVGEDIG